ncbi:MAG: glycine zipper 2TM domain-containing protein, partial [Polymorphobacter sp.]
DKRRYQESRKNARNWNRGNQYGWDRPDPRYNGYYADNYYRSGNYRPVQLTGDDRIYRGNDNRYYCRRKDGTTGLIVGALGGGVLGNVIAPGGSKTLGSILGGSLGAVLGNAITSGNVSCR